MYVSMCSHSHDVHIPGVDSLLVSVGVGVLVVSVTVAEREER